MPATGRKSDIRDSILDTIGETPLVRLSRIGAGVKPQLVAKMEMFNPGGSIKDRVALRLIEAAERDGSLRPGGTIVEPTSGNTGTGLAIAARLKGYRVIAVMPDKMSREKIDLLRAYGAEVVIAPTDVAPESPQSYYRVADRLTEEIPGAFQPNQYRNPPTRRPTTRRPGPELWRQTGGRVTHLVVGVGTGGTITGMARYLREQNPASVVIGADPVGSIYSGDEVHPYLVEGVGEDFWPTHVRPVRRRPLRARQRPRLVPHHAPARRRPRGCCVGGSCGLAVHAALEVARELDDSDAMIAVDPARRRARVPLEDLQRHLDGVARDARAHERPQRRRRAARQAGRGRDPAARRGRDAAEGQGRDRAAARAPRLPAAGRLAHRSRARSSARSASAGCSSTPPTTRGSWARRSST